MLIYEKGLAHRDFDRRVLCVVDVFYSWDCSLDHLSMGIISSRYNFLGVLSLGFFIWEFVHGGYLQWGLFP